MKERQILTCGVTARLRAQQLKSALYHSWTFWTGCAFGVKVNVNTWSMFWEKKRMLVQWIPLLEWMSNFPEHSLYSAELARINFTRHLELILKPILVIWIATYIKKTNLQKNIQRFNKEFSSTTGLVVTTY